MHLRHRWQIAAVEHATGSSRWNDGSPYTFVLRRCECGKTGTDQLDGHWPFNALTGKDVGTVRVKN